MVWGRGNVFFLTIGLPVNVEKASLEVKNVVVLEALHRKVKRQQSTKQCVLISRSEIVSRANPWKRRVRASSWVWRLLELDPKLCLCHPRDAEFPVGGECVALWGHRGDLSTESGHSERTSRWEKKNIPPSRPGEYNLFCPHSPHSKPPVCLQRSEGFKNIVKLTKKKTKNLGMMFKLFDLAVWVGVRWVLISWCN